VRRGDIVLVALPGDYGKPRPALVVQSDALTADDCGSVLVCPLSSHLTGSTSFRIAVDPTESNGLRARSEIMVEKLAGVARSRLRGGIGRLDRAALTEVERALLLVLGFA